MNQKQQNREIPPLWVERAALGELTVEQEQQLAQRFGTAFNDRQAAIAAGNDEILRDYPAQAMAAKIEQRMRRDATQHSKRPALGMWGLPAVAALTFLVLWRSQDGSEQLPELAAQSGEPVMVAQRDAEVVATERVKGLQAHLTIFRREGARAQRLAPEQKVKSGDVLQLAYVAAGQKRGVIVSIDGRGHVTTHFPDTQLAAASSLAPALVGTGETALANAYELDDAPAFEKFIFVTTDRPEGFAWRDVVVAAEKLVEHSDSKTWASAPLDLPAGLEQHSYLLRKSE